MLIREIAIPDYDLPGKYAKFNTELFGGQLPAISLKWANLKGKVGIVQTKTEIDPNVPRPHPMMIRLRRATRWDNHRPVMSTMVLKLNSLVRYDETQFDGILIHEMIHVWFFVNQGMGVEHGGRFIKMAEDLSQRSGIRIPLSDDREHSGLTDPNLRLEVMVVVLAKRDGSALFFLMTTNQMRKMFDEVKSRIATLVSYQSVKIYRISSELWTIQAHQSPLARSVKTLRLRPMSKELMDDLLAHGAVVYDAKEPITEWEDKGKIKSKSGRIIKYGTEYWNYHHGQHDGSVIAYDDVYGIRVGQLAFSIYQDKGKIKMIEVNPDYQREGIASEMVKIFRKEVNGNFSWGGTTHQGARLRTAYNKSLKLDKDGDNPVS